MKLPILLSLAALGLTAGLARADSLSDNPPKSTTICLDSGGHQAAVHCRAQASRIDAREDICICPGATQQVKVSVCEAGVKPPGESAAYMRDRLKAVSHGSVVGATWQGQPMCVAPRNQGS
jgi:hypothetical protein